MSVVGIFMAPTALLDLWREARKSVLGLAEKAGMAILRSCSGEPKGTLQFLASCGAVNWDRFFGRPPPDGNGLDDYSCAERLMKRQWEQGHKLVSLTKKASDSEN